MANGLRLVVAVLILRGDLYGVHLLRVLHHEGFGPETSFRLCTRHESDNQTNRG